MQIKKFSIGLGIALFAGIGAYWAWPRLINLVMPSDSRPGRIRFQIERTDAEGLDRLAASLKASFGRAFKHAGFFKKSGVFSYEGPSTCLGCHPRLKIKDSDGKVREMDLIKNLLDSSHYAFFTRIHPNVYGFNGEVADDFPMGKIDRPCPKPGSFAFTAWAEKVDTREGRHYSEGCGQCHVGGQYQAPLGELMPGYRTLEMEKEAVDCLICHAAAYDMNRKQVVEDPGGRLRWEQDRSMRAAVSVEKPTAQACLRCHQHNFGGDTYADDLDPSYMESLRNTGHERPRVLHPGSKRGTPYSPSWDVHAAAGLSCLDCHASEGHLIARGRHTTTIMANDLPAAEVACESCHGGAPHAKASGQVLNRHTARLSCTICHIPSLHPDNVTMRDFSTPEYEPASGLWIYKDTEKETAPGKGIIYQWWNGAATFLGNPIGDHPNGKGRYRFYRPSHIWPEFKDFDYAGWYESTMRPIAKAGRPSKLYPFKRYNGKQLVDLANMGPFGAMFVPYNLPTYYTTGDSGLAGQREMEKSMMKRIYGWMFKVYLMDRFMGFMDVPRWDTGAYASVHALKKSEARWIPMDASLEISHAIRKEGALRCSSCHGPGGVLDWEALGYTDEEAAALSKPREES